MNERDLKPIASPVTRINKLLKAAGYDFRLVRGRGYYYLSGGIASGFFSSMICVCQYERTEKDFRHALDEVNEILKSNDLKQIGE